METFLRRGVSVILAALVPALALAHDTWLLPASFRVAPGEPVVLELTSAMRFPEPETAVKADRFASTGLRMGGVRRPLESRDAGARVLGLSAPTSASGIATAWVETLPRDIDLDTQEVEEYLAEAGASDVRDRWVKDGRKPWHETYVKCAKSFVRVGEPASDRSWAEPAGLALEIVPDVDPTALAVARPLTLRVLEDGKPAVDLALSAVAAGAKPVTGTTDAEGRATLSLSQKGRWLIKAVRIRPADAAGSWKSRFTTLTVTVAEP